MSRSFYRFILFCILLGFFLMIGMRKQTRYFLGSESSDEVIDTIKPVIKPDTVSSVIKIENGVRNVDKNRILKK